MQQRIRGQAFGTILLIALQFVLGMILNLFVSLPGNHPGANDGNYFTRSGHSFAWAISFGGGVVLFLHVLVALALLGSSISLLVRTILRPLE